MAICKKGYKQENGRCVKKTNIWKNIFIILGIATLLDLRIPDPLPYIDETLLIGCSLVSLYESLT
jgi:hypothetical protein